MILLEALGEKGLKNFNEMLKNTSIADIPKDEIKTYDTKKTESEELIFEQEKLL